MRKIVFMVSVSMDGFMEGPEREIDWHLVDEELHGHFNERLAAMGAFLDGRVSYELMAEAWPEADQDPENTAGRGHGLGRRRPRGVLPARRDPHLRQRRRAAPLRAS